MEVKTLNVNAEDLPEDLQKGLAALLGIKGHEEKPIEEQIAALREFAAAYDAVPFSKGDLVTPRVSAGLKGVGRPYIVLEVNKDAEPVFNGNPSNGDFGLRPQMRVARLCPDGHIHMWWGEASDYEPFVGEQPEKPNA